MATAEEIMDSQDRTNLIVDNEGPDGGAEVSLDQGELELEIEVVDDRPPEDRRPPANPDAKPSAGGDLTDEEMKLLSQKAQDRIKKLKWEFHEERRQKEAAERMAAEAVEHTRRVTKERERAQSLLSETQKALTEAAKRRAEAAMQDAENRLRIAQEAGDHEAITKATKDMTQAQMAQAYAPAAARQVIQRWTTENPEDADDTTSPTQVPATDYVPDKRAIEWRENNPWFLKDKEMTSLALGIHEKLIHEDGITPESEEYYTRIDARMRQIFPDRFEGGQKEDVVVETSQSPAPRPDLVVAPATRSNGATPRKITLTATQVSLAKTLGLTTEQYARQLLKEQREQANV